MSASCLGSPTTSGFDLCFLTRQRSQSFVYLLLLFSCLHINTWINVNKRLYLSPLHCLSFVKNHQFLALLALHPSALIWSTCLCLRSSFRWILKSFSHFQSPTWLISTAEARCCTGSTRSPCLLWRMWSLCASRATRLRACYCTERARGGTTWPWSCTEDAWTSTWTWVRSEILLLEVSLCSSGPPCADCENHWLRWRHRLRTAFKSNFWLLIDLFWGVNWPVLCCDIFPGVNLPVWSCDLFPGVNWPVLGD